MPASERLAATLHIDDTLLAAHPNVYGAGPAARCLALAQALTSGPAWERLRGNRLVVRPATGMIGVFGTASREDRVLVDALGSQVPSLLRRLRPVGYDEAEHACSDLAIQLRSRFGEDELRQVRIVGIPRGGLIVAGLLSYALGLPTSDNAAAELTILVDDCSLSGLRLREALKDQPSGRIVVALLHAHPELCRRVEQEDRVIACVAARDLVDHAPMRADYAEWKERWRKRLPRDYWTGDPDHVVYPWNEPDAGVWNEHTKAAQAGWRVVPPAWCLKNRMQAHEAGLQVCSAGVGPLTPVDTVVWADEDDEVTVAGGDPVAGLALRGTGAAMWRALVPHGRLDEAAATVAGKYGIAVTTVRADLARFVDDLVRRGFLEPA